MLVQTGSTMRYCWHCGSRLMQAPPTRCGACGQEHYANPKPCGEAVVLHDGRVLLVRRGHEPWRGCWDTPGGFCEAAEHPMQAAERELLEEVGLAARAIAYLGSWVDVYGPAAADGLQEHTVISAYVMRTLGDLDELGDLTSLQPQAGEVTAIAWFPLDALPLSELAFPQRTRLVLAVAARFASDPGAFPEPSDRTWD